MTSSLFSEPIDLAKTSLFLYTDSLLRLECELPKATGTWLFQFLVLTKQAYNLERILCTRHSDHIVSFIILYLMYDIINSDCITCVRCSRHRNSYTSNKVYSRNVCLSSYILFIIWVICYSKTSKKLLTTLKILFLCLFLCRVLWKKRSTTDRFVVHRVNQSFIYFNSSSWGTPP